MFKLWSWGFLVEVLPGTWDALLPLGRSTDLLGWCGPGDHSFFGTLAAGGASEAHQRLHRDSLLGSVEQQVAGELSACGRASPWPLQEQAQKGAETFTRSVRRERQRETSHF